MSVSDSTDWLSTPLSSLAPLDSALRCQVCKDYLTTPMITSCSHTFCSLCIRRCLSQDGRCPVCREQDQEMKLRRNWVVEELVTNFAQSRTGLLKFAKTAAERDREDEDENQRPKKRRKINEDLAAPVERRSTRSQSRRDAVQSSQQSTQSGHVGVVEDSEGEGEYDYQETAQSPAKRNMQTEQNDGLVACPMCGKRMKEPAVYPHLDTCTGTSSDGALTPPHTKNGFHPESIAYTIPDATRQNDRLPTINYALLSENQLRKKLKELGIPPLGSRTLLQKRHTEWLNLWNANCDARKPRSKRELLRELETWERSQGRQIANNAGPNGVMVKEFDRVGYVRANKDDFDDLIRKARERRQTAKLKETAPGDGDTSAGMGAETQASLQEIFAPQPEIDDHVQQHSIAELGSRQKSEGLLPYVSTGVVDLTSPSKHALEPSQSQESRTDIAV